MVGVDINELGLVYLIIVLSLLIPALYEGIRNILKLGVLVPIPLYVIRIGAISVILVMFFILGICQIWEVIHSRFILSRISLMFYCRSLLL